MRRAVVALLAAAALVMGCAVPASAAVVTLLPATLTPAISADEDTAKVELGLKFQVKQTIDVSAVRYYQGSSDENVQQATIWDASGNVLARSKFSKTTEAGWRSVPIKAVLEPGAYRVSYLTSNGSYAATVDYFTAPRTVNTVTIPTGAGVYKYGGGFPTEMHRNSNYFVDVQFEVVGAVSPEPTPTPTTTPTPAPTTPILDLPRIPWEGGPAYWAQFPNAQKWTDPNFFPIGIWYNGISSDDEAQWDKAHGINSYSGMWEGTDFSLFERNDVYWLGGKLNASFKDASLNWPGVHLDDEVDGRYEAEAGIKFLQGLHDAQANSGKFTQANFTQLVIGSDLPVDQQQRYVDIPDAVSLDMYWYTIPFCDWEPYRGDLYADPVPQETCRTASSYGKAVNGLTIRDSVDGELKPRWMFIENLNGLSGHEHGGYISPGQLKGAAMSSVINEARGLYWFNQSYTGDCQSTSVLRTAQVQGDAFCGAPQVKAMGEVNNLIHSLAPVINTQSYQWDFGPNLDTMLKVKDGYAYVFAMTDGGAGQRTFTLPQGVDGSVEVVGESRTLTATGGTFTDGFAAEYEYHIYRIALAGS